MCGIIGYIGSKDAVPLLLNGLKRLEYRGYDSAGIAIGGASSLKIYKTSGKVVDLESKIINLKTKSNIGIGHTRWATHGEPNNINAHPHLSSSNKIALIHNGIIENYDVLKKELKKRGYKFQSDTDTEVLVHLIEDIMINYKVSLFEATRLALNEIVGAYAIAVISSEYPGLLVAATKGSPLVVGIGENEYFVSSDGAPIIEHTKQVIYLKDEEIVQMQVGEDLIIKTIKNKKISPYIQKLKINLENIEKEGYDYFMLKEIFEQPKTISDCMRGRLNLKDGVIKLGGITDFENKILNASRIILIGCGTSWHAALIGEYLLESLSRIPVEVEYASEFRYRNPIINENDVVICLSQSGETADTIAALKIAKEKGALVLGICNVVGSTISRLTDSGIYTHAGPEIGVASTKAITAQIIVLALFATLISRKKGTITESFYRQIITEMSLVPKKVKEVLDSNKNILKIAKTFRESKNFLYLGRGYNFPVALEGALKLKEISYIHAEGYPAAEMKHGPIALIDEKMPVVVLATNNINYDKVVSNIQEVKARKGVVIAIVTSGDTQVKKIADHIIEIPETIAELSSILSLIPLQLLSYHIAVLRGCNVDQPRNLAKSVTVE
tara:strand:+ start:4452 stop:6293 length:1842 start_codon:yes stop_codon:yes gene_type:complete